MFNAAMVMKMKLALVAPAVIKNNLPKNPAVGGMPARENKANASIQQRKGFVL